MKAMKKAAVVMFILFFGLGAASRKAWAEDTIWNIENKADKEVYTKGETMLVSVYLKGADTAAPASVSSLSGILEYDNSLFTVEKADILPVESGKVQSVSFDQAACRFDVVYGSPINVKNESLLIQIRLHIAADASIGRTTVCVTDLEWKSSGSQQTVSIEHRVPVKLTLTEVPVLLGDVNDDGEVNLADAKLVIQHYNKKKKLNSKQKKRADVNGDGKVNLTDAKLIMQYYNGDIAGF